jgi:conjugal transfer pilus assembly protein TraW
MKWMEFSLLLIGFSVGAEQSSAEKPLRDLGVVGAVFPIKERNIMTVIQEKLASPEGKKLLSNFEKHLKQISETHLYVPMPNKTLSPTPKHRSYLFNPSISLDKDLFDHKGTRFYQAGTKVNPLDHITLSKDYLFIDGDRPVQVAWARHYKASKNVMIILVKGDPLQVMRDHGIQVFFDQKEAMAARFQLTHVPCSMTQEGRHLRMTEWVEDELKTELEEKNPAAQASKKKEGAE